MDQCPELSSAISELRPDTQPEQHDLVSHMAQKKMEGKKKETKKNRIK